MKLLILGDSTATALLSQYVPIGKLLGKEYTIDYYACSPVNLQLAYHMPFINYVLCGKVSGKTNELDYIEPSEGFKYGVQKYFYDADVNISEVKVSQRFFNKIEEYDKILILYDGEFYPILWLIREVFSRYEHKCIGRFGDWNKDMAQRNLQKYIPKEAVESLGFQWDDNLLKLEYDWYKEFDTKIPYKKNSLFLQCSAGCESFMPYHDWQTFFPCGKLGNFLRKQGFDVILSNRREDIRRQLFNLKANYVLFIDSITLWLGKAFSSKYMFCYSCPCEINSIQIGYDTIIGEKYSNLHQLTPELILEVFLESLKKEGCPLRGKYLI